MLLGLYQLNLQAPRLYAVIAPLAGWIDPTAEQILAGQSGSGAPATWHGSTSSPAYTQNPFDWPTLASGLSSGTSYRIALVWSDGVVTSNVTVGNPFSTVFAAVGDLLVTEAGVDTAALLGRVAVSGAISVAEVSGSDSFAAAGAALVAGLLAAVEGVADTTAIAGHILVRGALNATDVGSDTAVLSALVPGAPRHRVAASVPSRRPANLAKGRRPANLA